MPRWTVGDGDHEFVVEVTREGQVTLDITGGGPFVVSPESAEEVRAKIGAAIGAARAPRS